MTMKEALSNTPNYRVQTASIAMLCGNLPCCAKCRHSMKWGDSSTHMDCSKRSGGNSHGHFSTRQTRVSNYGICDFFELRSICNYRGKQ